MRKKLHTVRLKGPISVAYKKLGKLHVYNALEFDIAGTGFTKEAAFREMKELVEEYLLFVVKTLHKGKKISFFNPAEDFEWNNCKTRDEYVLTVVIEVVVDDLPPREIDLKELAPYSDSMRAVDLVPA